MSLAPETLPLSTGSDATTGKENAAKPVEHEPDYRFTLANERTFLAWIRTALALLAGAIAIIQLVPHFGVPHISEMLGTFLALSSIAITLYSGWRWYRVQDAMQRDARLPPSHAVWLIICTLVFVGTVIVFLTIAKDSGA